MTCNFRNVLNIFDYIVLIVLMRQQSQWDFEYDNIEWIWKYGDTVPVYEY